MKVFWLKLSFLTLLSVLLTSLCFSDTKPKLSEDSKVPILIGRCVGNCLYDTLSQEYAFYLADAAKHSKLAIRLCSNERFEVAIAKASGNLIAITDEFRRRGDTNLDDIELLLSDSCLPKANGRVATEFWAIPPTASPPSHSRDIKLKTASITVVGEASHQSKVEEFVKLLRERLGSYGVVIGSYFRHPSSTLKRKTRDAEEQIKINPDMKGRFSTYLIPYGIIYTGYIEPKEPDFVIVQILK